MGVGTRWSYSAGERGRNRVRAFEEPKTGILFLEFYLTDSAGERRRKRVSLGHRDRERAIRQADDEAAQREGATFSPDGPITLSDLFELYTNEVTPQKSKGKQTHDLCCAAMFLQAFGPHRPAGSLTRRDWERFIRGRGDGSIRPAQKAKGTPVGNRQIAYDLSWLRAVLNWATRAGDDMGKTLLDRTPLAGLRLPREPSPRRPIASEDRCAAMREVAPRIDWRFDLALVLAHETGHRMNSIRQLRWSDVDLVDRRLRWRGENDKIGFDHVTPLTAGAVEALRTAVRQFSMIGEGWILPAPRSPDLPCSRHLMRDWWLRAERLAGLSHVEGQGWHSLRRKFATELKDTPLKDLCYLGGWKSPQTLLTCYQRADEDTMRQALEQRRRVSSGSIR